jgi:hypothetical protein
MGMDEIDSALMAAWNKVAPTLKRDRVEALRRAARPPADRSIRPWCLAIRAADNRITPILAKYVDPHAADLAGVLPPHRVLLSPTLLMSLLRPVTIAWPGMPASAAAPLLGRHVEGIRPWLKHGVFQITYEAPSIHGHRGKPVPVIWSTSPLDPNADRGSPPHAMWGTLWQTLAKTIPQCATLDAERVPMFTNTRHGELHRGWKFICPGLEKPCGRETEKLYLPRPVCTIFHQLGDIGFRWTDTEDAARWTCHRCHRIRYCSLSTRNGWNEFVTHLTRGLLYGCEVKRPASVVYVRKRRYVKHRRA